jgi:hypothetical protein
VRPAYPIDLDAEGLPVSFGHAKLHGSGSPDGTSCRGAAPAYTNVGVRIYRAAALLEQVEFFRSGNWVEGLGYSIPGNDPGGCEFALDNVDARLAASLKARILAVSRPEELTPAKSVDDLAAFERAVAVVLNDTDLDMNSGTR